MRSHPRHRRVTHPRAWRRTLLATGAIAVTAAMVAVTAPASVAATLAGPWAPFSYCPVDDPVMLASPASNGYGTACVAATSPSGTFQIGKTTITTGATSLQFGLSGAETDNPRLGNIVQAPDGKTLVAAPVDVPGGLLGLVGPLAKLLHGLNGVTATVELAGAPTGFNAAAAFSTGQTMLTLPVKIHLTNPLLGKKCYIGTDKDPIVLQPKTTDTGTLRGVPAQGASIIAVTGATLADDSFAVPGASGCGLGGLLDGAVNAKEHLPSPAGSNKLVMNDVDSSLALAFLGGQALSTAWHANVTGP